MVDGRIPEKEPEHKPSPWQVSFEDAVSKDAGVVRAGDNQPAPKPWMARPGVAPIFQPSPTAPAGENLFAPSLERMQRPQEPVINPGAFAPPSAPPIQRPGAGPAAVAPPFAAPEAPDGRTSRQPAGTSPFASPFAPKPGDTTPKPVDTTPKPAPPTLPPTELRPLVPPGGGGRATFGGGVDQTIPWSQWVQQNPGGVAVPPRPGGLPGGGAPGLPGGGVSPPPAGSDRPGVNTTTQVVNLPPERRQAIEDALHNAVPVESHLVGGAVWGAMLNTGKWGMDVAYSNGHVQWWGPYSPMMQKLGAEQLRIESAQELHAAAEATKAMASDALGPASEKIKGLISGLDTKMIAATVSNPAVEMLARQHSFLKDASNLLDPAKIQGVLGTAEEVAAGSKLFVAGSTEATQLMDYAKHAVGQAAAADPAALIAARQSLIAGIETKIGLQTAGGAAAATTLGENELTLLTGQRSFLTNIENLTNLKKIQSVIGTAEQVASGQPVNGVTKLFVTGSPEAQTLLERAQLHGDFYKARQAATAAEKGLDKLETELQALKDAGAGNGFAAGARGFMTGALVTGTTIGAGYLADKYILGHSPQMNGFDRFLIDGVAIPGVMLTPGIPIRYKIGASIGLFGLARAKAYFDDAGVPALSQSSLLMRPTTIDTIGFTTAALAPLGVRGKLAIAAGTLVAGRAYNAISHAAGWDGPDGIELRDNLRNSLARDANTKSSTTYTSGIDAGLQLAKHKAGEGALDLQLADVTNAQGTMNKLDYLRQHALLSETVGLARLEKGSRIVEGGGDAVAIYGDDARILKDKKYDFLGESMLSLDQAFIDLTDLRYAVFQEKGKVNADTSLNETSKKAKSDALDAEMKQCDAERQKILDTLKGIFGDHDMNAIFKELTDACRVRNKDMDQILYKRKQLFETLTASVNPEVRAKFARDLAVGFLAEAQYRVTKNNGEEANIMYQCAMDYLGRAKNLAPNNPCIPKLQTIAQELSLKIPRATTTQYQSNWNNPFELKPTTPSIPFKLPGMK